jgi:hypothetical protein
MLLYDIKYYVVNDIYDWLWMHAFKLLVREFFVLTDGWDALIYSVLIAFNWIEIDDDW